MAGWGGRRRARPTIAMAIVAGTISLVAAATPAGGRLEGGDRSRPGTLDRWFGHDGIVLTDHAGGGDSARDVLVQPDGAIVAVGTRVVAGDRPTDDMAVARYDRHGRLDRRFGNGGRVATDFGGRLETAEAVLRQRDGKIVAAGSAWDPNGLGPDFAIARYQHDGSLDPTFGDGGTVTTSILENDYATSVALQRDGRILVAGYADGPPEGYASAVLIRYTTDGELDPTFGESGIVVTQFLDEDRSNAWIEDIAVAPDGTIVAAGLAARLDRADWGVARFRADGTLDPRFGEGGVATVDTTLEAERATGVALSPDGGITLLGAAENTWNLARLRPDGTLDPWFGDGGIVRAGIVGDPYDIAVQPDRRIVVGGRTSPSGNDYDATVARFRRDGTIDTSFGTNGVTTTDVAGGTQDANAVALQRDGDIVVAGTSEPIAPTRTGADFLVARYHG